MNKFLMFIDDSDAAVTYPVDRLYSMICPSNALINLKFESSIGNKGADGASADTVALTITADKEQEVMQSICEAIDDKRGNPVIIVANDVKEAATAIIGVADGDANNGIAEKNYITLVSTDRTTKTYVFVDDNATTVATGDVLTAGSDTGASTAGSALADGIAVAINLTGSLSNQNAILVQLKAAVEHADGHNGKITVSSVPAAADGLQSITLTQAVAGNAGNTNITFSVAENGVYFSGNQSGLEDTTSDALDGDVFAGGVDGVYINPNITACAITIDS